MMVLIDLVPDSLPLCLEERAWERGYGTSTCRYPCKTQKYLCKRKIKIRY